MRRHNLGMTERGFRKLLGIYRDRKDEAVIHGLRNRRSNRRVNEETAARAVAAVKRGYRDFGPTLAAEYLKDVGIELSRETLRTVADAGGSLEGEAAEDQGGPCVAAPAQLPG